jgi:hypothetical protein
VVKENESALVYYMPKTQLAITLSYDRIEKVPGVFYQYAERYLGTSNVTTEHTITYQLNNMTLGTHASADTTRAYEIPVHGAHNTHLVSLTQDGRLLGYNCEPAQHECNISQPMIVNTSCDKEQLLPLLEEQLMASSTAKMAEGAAKLIYRIRETRIQLLAGDVEHLPADGTSMQLVLEELDKQEKQLVELFIGTTTITPCTHTLYYTPDEDVTDLVIGRFSRFAGVVSHDDLSGEPIYLTLQGHKHVLQEPKHKFKACGLFAYLYYNLPGTANVVLRFQNKHLAQEVAVAQYGVSIPVSNSLFIGKKVSIVINPETGNILSIQQ